MTATEPTTRTCKACTQTKDVSEFYRIFPRHGAKPHYLSRCKECEKAYQRQRYAAQTALRRAKETSGEATH